MENKRIRGLTISQMTLGTVQLGMEYGIANSTGKPDREQSFGILEEAVKGGVNSFDTALAYGDSEMILGEYFSQKTSKDSDCVITTKFSFKERKQFTENEIEKEVINFAHKSLLRLRKNKLQVVMLHHHDDLDFYGTKLAKAMKTLKSEGLAEMTGVSVHDPYSIKKVLGYKTFDAIQAPVNVLDTRLPESGLLEEMKKEEMIVFVRSVFLQGLIFKDNANLPPVLKCAGPYLEKLRNIAENENLEIAQLAIAYIRDLTGVTSLVIGSETKEQVEKNIEYINTPALSEKAVEDIRKSFTEVPEIIINPVKWVSR